MSEQLETESGQVPFVVHNEESAVEAVAWFINEAMKRADQLTIDQVRIMADDAHQAATILGPEAQYDAYSGVLAAARA